MVLRQFKKIQLNHVKKYVIGHFTLVTITSSLLLGVLLGALVIRWDGFTSVLNFSLSFDRFLETRQLGGFLTVAFHSFWGSFVFLLAVFCCGLFIYGLPLCYFIPILRGMGFGAIGGYLYSTYGLKGVAFSFLVILPATFLNVGILLVGARESARFSASMFTGYFRGFSLNVGSRDFKRYHNRFLLLLVLTVIVSFIDAGLSTVFISVFGF